MKTLVAILTVITLTTSVNASEEVDNRIKELCKFTLYGEGEDVPLTKAYIIGMLSGMLFAVPKEERTEFAETATLRMTVEKTCNNAFMGISEYGFENDFKWEALRLISKKYSL